MTDAAQKGATLAFAESALDLLGKIWGKGCFFADENLGKKMSLGTFVSQHFFFGFCRSETRSLVLDMMFHFQLYLGIFGG